MKFKLPLTTLFLEWGKGFPVQKLVVQGYLPFVAVTSGFSWMSAVAHFFVLIFFSTYYIPDLRRGINRFRWIEYAFSSSLMIGLIAMLFGMYDIISLVLIMSVNATMNLFGFLMETSNVGKNNYDWTPFTFGGKRFDNFLIALLFINALPTRIFFLNVYSCQLWPEQYPGLASSRTLAGLDRRAFQRSFSES